MKTKAALATLFFFLVGCASQHHTSNSQPVTFSGHPVTAFGREAEQIWQNQLTKGFRVKNKAIVRAVREGIAEISNNGGSTWTEAKVGAVLTENSTIRTDAHASADLFLGDNGPVIRLTESTELHIVHLSLENAGIMKHVDTMLELPRGRILGNVKKLSADSTYLIRTHGGIIQIRGTEFSAAADGTFSVDAGSGVIYAKGTMYQVKPGEEYVPARR